MFANTVFSALVTLYVFTDVVAFSTAVTSSACMNLTIVTRSQWGARTPRSRPVVIPTPVNMTFIHHSDTPGSTTSDGCRRRVQSIQNFHMDVRGWNDIGYSFLICEDGRVYEGRGWNIEGAHTKGYNTIALGMCFIGTFTTTVPDLGAVTAGRNLLLCGIGKGFIVPTYELFGHRDGGYTDCPGNALYAFIRSWPNFSTRPIPKYKSVPDGSEAKINSRIQERLRVKNTKL